MKYIAALLDRGGGIGKGVVDTGGIQARPESDMDIRRAAFLAAWLAVFRPELR